ncbi:hypothetical protein ACWGBV_26185 [Streptomyces sp. NPDC055051]
MPDPTIKDVLDRIDSLRGTMPSETVKVPNLDIEKLTEEEEKKQKEALKRGEKPKPVPEDDMVSISKFKHSLIEQSPKILTERHLPAQFITKIDDMHKELVKHPVTEWLEAAGLDGIAAGFEKIQENTDWKTYLPYFVSAVVGSVIAIAAPLFALMFVSKLQIFQRGLQTRLFDWLAAKFPTRLGHLSTRTVALNDQMTGPGLVDRTHLNNREAMAAGGLGALPPNANFNDLREQLRQINPHLTTFNGQAPDFVSNLGKMPKPGAVKKIAEAVRKLKEAMTGVDSDKIGQVADAVKKFDPDKFPDPRKLDKLNKAVDKAKPETMRAIAKAVGKLVGAQQHLEPQRWQDLPKAQTLSSAAKSAERLAKAGHQVADAFDALKTAAQQAAAAI